MSVELSRKINLTLRKPTVSEEEALDMVQCC